MHLAISVLKREEPLVREISLVESVIHRAAVAERPQSPTALVDDAPCGAGPRSHAEHTKAPFADAHRCAALTRRRAPEWLAITGATAKSNGQSAPDLQALSHCISAITVLCLDESPLEPSRSFHDVLLPRLIPACKADGARVR